MVSSVIVFIIVLSVLVLVHEAGHFFAAKRAGILVEEFGFGLPPRLVGKKIGETIYSVNLLPFGGFVKLHGENAGEEINKPSRAFLNKSKKVRFAIVTAGVVMNFLLGMAAFSIVYSFLGVPRDTNEVKIVDVAKDSPATQAGLQADDIVLRVGEDEVKTTGEFIEQIDTHKGGEVALTIKRGGLEEEIAVTPRENPPEGQGSLGVVISSAENYFPPIWQRPFWGVYYGFKEALFWSGIVVFGFIHIFRQLFSGTVPNDIAGPVGIFALTSQAASYGILTLINFVGVLSVNLAILNILPFPALDGGRLLFIVLESFLGKKVLPKLESVIHAVGMVILLLLILAITFYDIRRLISAGGVAGFLETITPQ